MNAEEDGRPSAVRESLAIPADLRRKVDERDQQCCRMCGKFLGDERAIHHIIFGGDDRGMGGRRIHVLEEMITLCWMWGGSCHDRAHRQKKRWQQILLYCATRRGVTAFQVERWQSAANRKSRSRNNGNGIPVRAVHRRRDVHARVRPEGTDHSDC